MNKCFCWLPQVCCLNNKVDCEVILNTKGTVERSDSWRIEEPLYDMTRRNTGEIYFRPMVLYLSLQFSVQILYLLVCIARLCHPLTYSQPISHSSLCVCADFNLGWVMPVRDYTHAHLSFASSITKNYANHTYHFYQFFLSICINTHMWIMIRCVYIS